MSTFLKIYFNDQNVKSFRPTEPQTVESLKNLSISVILDKMTEFQESDFSEASIKITRFVPEFDEWEDIDTDDQLESGGKICVVVILNGLQEILVLPNEQAIHSTPVGNVLAPGHLSESVTPNDGQNSLAKAGCTLGSISASKINYLFKDSQAFDIDAIIESCNASDRNIILKNFTEQMMQKPGSRFDEARMTLVAVCGQYLLKQCFANGRDKPTALEKGRMAFSIWLKFPFYQQNKPGGFPFGKLYDPMKNTGYLENYVVNQVRYVKRKLFKQEDAKAAESSLEKKPKKAAKTTVARPSEQLITSDEIQLKLRDLSKAAPDGNAAKSHEAIVVKMNDLYDYRRLWIMSDPNVKASNILAKFPCLATMPALMISEFEHIMSDLGVKLPDMDLRWQQTVDFVIEECIGRVKKHTMVKNLLDMFSLERLDDAKELPQGLRANLALQLLPIILRPLTFGTGRGNRDKMPVVHAITHLVQHKKVCDNKPIRSVIDEAKKDKKLTQPFLLVFTPYGGEGEKANQIFVVVDYTPIEVPEASYMKAVKYLFASFFVFNTDYPIEALGQVYEFFEYLFSIKNSTCSKAKGKGNAAEDLFDKLMLYINAEEANTSSKNHDSDSEI